MMASPETYWLIGASMLILSFLPPTIGYLRAISHASALIRPIPLENPPEISILLPIRNESSSIMRKLTEIAESEYPMSRISLLIADSCSSDNSIELAQSFLENSQTGLSWQFLTLDRPGKSIAINESLEKIETDIFLMMDSDASTGPNAVGDIVSWFQVPEIGAVCGASSEILEEEKGYRKRFNILRTSESVIDSTPIFEGSICAFRIEALGGSGIESSINADDSQMAIKVRRNGFRSIMDTSIPFHEPERRKTTLKRQVRRAQGLSRTLWLNRDLCIAKNGKYTRIFRNQFYFHLLFPWLVILSSSIIIMTSISENMNSLDFSRNRFDFSLSLLPLSLISRTIRNLSSGIFALSYSHLLLLSGIKLNIWDPGQRG